MLVDARDRLQYVRDGSAIQSTQAGDGLRRDRRQGDAVLRMVGIPARRQRRPDHENLTLTEPAIHSSRSD